LAIVGSGSVLLNLIGRDAEDGLPAHVDATQTRYEFSDSAAPVPEPMTLLLVGGGLAAAWRRNRACRTLNRLP
jgi:hypothetical protein